MSGADLSQLPQGEALRQQVVEGGLRMPPQLSAILPPPDPKDAGFVEQFADARRAYARNTQA